MRRFLIRSVLPLVFCALPLLAAGLTAAVLPPDAVQYYVRHMTSLDYFMLALGTALFVIQSLLGWRALQWRGTAFDERPDRWITHLAQAAEWFPLLGLLGTVAGILRTFGSITGPTAPAVVVALYAPAITATGSGLFMALINILPSWTVLMGRDLIRTLAGEPEPAAPPVHVEVNAAPRPASAVRPAAEPRR
jgi:hypothetical protein